MPTGKLNRYFQKRIITVIRMLNVPPDERDEETFHRLRVEIKKINAFYSLLEFADKKFKRKKYFKPFKKVFDRAGKVRSLQMNVLLLKKFRIDDPELLHALVSKIEKRKVEYAKPLSKKLSKDIFRVEKDIEKFTKNISDEILNEYHQRSLSQVSSILSSRFHTDELHKSRKKIKDILYNLKLLFPRHQLIRKLNHLQRLIGDWHDHTVALKFIEQGNVSAGKTLSRKITQSRLELYRKINHSRSQLEWQ